MQKNEIKTIRLPWKDRDVPHGLLDIIRGCNISCRDCYNTESNYIKPLDQVKEEIDLMLSLRKLDSLSIIGGEPILHPDLVEILDYASKRIPHLEVFSNGFGLTTKWLETFKKFNVSIIFLHIEKDQKRGDLKANASEEDAVELRRKIAKNITEHGIEVALSITSEKDKPHLVTSAINESINNPDITYILITLFRDVQKIKSLIGDVRTGFQGNLVTIPNSKEVPYTNFHTFTYMKKEFNMLPFASLGSNKDPDDPRWLSYYVLCFHQQGNQEPIVHHLIPSYFEPLYMKFVHLFTRKYPFYQEQNEKIYRYLIRLNGIFGGDRSGNKAFLQQIKNKKGKLKVLRILFQEPAKLDSSGNLTYCSNCPDAIVKNGKLVPVCISDRVT